MVGMMVVEIRPSVNLIRRFGYWGSEETFKVIFAMYILVVGIIDET